MSRRPLVVASLPVRSKSDLARAREIESVDFVELRLDYLSDIWSIEPELIAMLERPVIATIRDIEEGGVTFVDPAAKTEYLRRLHDLGVVYDVEASFARRYVVPYEEKIVSAHYLDGLPSEEEVERVLEEYADTAFCVKIAVSATPGYKRLLSSILERGYENVAVMPVGSSPLERLAFALLGSMLVYSHVGEPTALGQMRYDVLLEVLRLLGLR